MYIQNILLQLLMLRVTNLLKHGICSILIGNSDVNTNYKDKIGCDGCMYEKSCTPTYCESCARYYKDNYKKGVKMIETSTKYISLKQEASRLSKYEYISWFFGVLLAIMIINAYLIIKYQDKQINKQLTEITRQQKVISLQQVEIDSYKLNAKEYMLVKDLL